MKRLTAILVLYALGSTLLAEPTTKYYCTRGEYNILLGDFYTNRKDCEKNCGKPCFESIINFDPIN